MTWLRFLNDCAEINKMLNASIKSLSTIHLAGPPPDTTRRIIRDETGVLQTRRSWGPRSTRREAEVQPRLSRNFYPTTSRLRVLTRQVTFDPGRSPRSRTAAGVTSAHRI